MKALNTERLNKLVETIKPYRASNPPRYPISKRTHNTKVFTIDELDGEKIYRIFYGFDYSREYVSKQEYLANHKTDGHYHEHTWVDDDSPERYSKYSTAPKELGIVRQDNTFEFTAKNGYGQGDNMIMTSWSVGSLSTNSRQGGMIFKEYWNDQNGIMHPIFRGLRVNCDTWAVHESSQYRVLGYRVDRKKGNEFLSGYADFYKVCEVMMQAMDTKNLLETGIEVALENGADLKSYFLPIELEKKFLAIAHREKNNTPLDCGLLFAMAHNVGEFYRRVRMYHESGMQKIYNDQTDNLFNNLKRKLNKELYRENKSVMKETEYTAGRYYPPSEWGIKLVDLQGNELQQY